MMDKSSDYAVDGDGKEDVDGDDRVVGIFSEDGDEKAMGQPRGGPGKV